MGHSLLRHTSRPIHQKHGLCRRKTGVAIAHRRV